MCCFKMACEYWGNLCYLSGTFWWIVGVFLRFLRRTAATSGIGRLFPTKSGLPASKLSCRGDSSTPNRSITLGSSYSLFWMFLCRAAQLSNSAGFPKIRTSMRNSDSNPSIRRYSLRFSNPTKLWNWYRADPANRTLQNLRPIAMKNGGLDLSRCCLQRCNLPLYLIFRSLPVFFRTFCTC